VIESMLDFCQRECKRYPEDVLLLGLGYGLGLNEHQLRYAKLESLTTLTISRPQERAPGQVALSSRVSRSLSTPIWLGRALSGHAEAENDLQALPFLFVRRSATLRRRATVDDIRRRVSRAGLRATGRPLSLYLLGKTRILDGRDRGFFFLAEEMGYARDYAIRLALGERVPVLPE
jgi:hypothetical protein